MCDSNEISITFNNEMHSSNSFLRMHEIQMQQKMCDVTLVFNGQRHKAHSIVLAGSSDYFKLMFYDKQQTVVTIENVNSIAMQRAIEYCYTGTIDIKASSMFDIINVASLLQLQPVIDACLDFMQNIINQKNCIKILNLLSLYSDESLKKHVLFYIQNHFEEISRTEEFLEIDVIQLKNVLECDHLNISSEDNVFRSVKRWILHDENRQEYISDLVALIRIPFITSKLFSEEILPFCLPNLACASMFTTNIRSPLNDKQNQQRKTANTVIIVGAFNQNRASIVEIYDPFKNSWAVLLDMKIDRRNFGSVLVNDSIITIGGYLGEKPVNSVESIDVKTGVKSQVPSMQTARSHIKAVYIGGYVYVAGGRGDKRSVAHLSEEEGLDAPVSSMERFDFTKKQWKYSTPMMTPREGYGVAVLGSEFYIVGGWSSGFASNATEAFCPLTGSWRRCGSMLVKRNWPGVVSANGYLYAIGGRSGYNFQSTMYSSVERFDPKENTWSIVAEFIWPRFAVGLGHLGNKLITAGGSAVGVGLVMDVTEYDPNARSWKILAPILSPREETDVISVPIDWLKSA